MRKKVRNNVRKNVRMKVRKKVRKKGPRVDRASWSGVEGRGVQEMDFQ